MTSLVLVEHEAGGVKPASRNAVTAARQLGEVHVLLAGAGLAEAASAAARLDGVAKVLVADDEAYRHGTAEPLARAVIGLAGGYSHIFAAATAFGKNVMPRVAALLDCQLISDVSAVLEADLFVRPIYAGNALATVRSLDQTKIVTVRTANFAPAPDGAAVAPVEPVSTAPAAGGAVFLSSQLAQSNRPELAAARIIVSGGRGMQSGENFARLIEPVADRLGAAIGASRAAVDAGFVGNDHQVGQTGKVVAPDLYIAVGISGAIQHLAGMKDSKIIVAINKDGDAPIFQVADYGIVGDLFEILPELTEALN